MQTASPVGWLPSDTGLALSGDLTASQVPRLASAVPDLSSAQLPSGQPPSIDLSEIGRVDSAGVALLFSWSQSLGYALPVHHAPEQLKQLVDIFSLAKAFDFR